MFERQRRIAGRGQVLVGGGRTRNHEAERRSHPVR